MKLFTLNTHSLIEPEWEKKLDLLADYIKKEDPDILAFQEVNQTRAAKAAAPALWKRYIRPENFQTELLSDNYGVLLNQALEKRGMFRHWTWISAKVGYGIYDEGMALFSKEPILEVDSFYISRVKDYENWKTRRVLGIRTADGWFYTVHMGWWNDEEEPFARQWSVLNQALEEKKGQELWLMGDFNSPAQTRGEGYDLIRQSGWRDTYLLAEQKDQGITAPPAIDGWKDQGRGSENEKKGMRIDQIWTVGDRKIKRSRVVLNGETEPVVSDHYGLVAETEQDGQ